MNFNKSEQLHPNWSALASSNFRLKRFVTAESSEDAPTTEGTRTYEIREPDGSEIKEFYDELIKNVQSKQKHHSKRRRRKQTNCSEVTEAATRCLEKITFEPRRFFCSAVANNVEELRKFRLEGDDINLRDEFGWTALMMAACEGACEAVELLLSLGADKHLRDKRSKSALDLARQKGHVKVVKLLTNELPSTSDTQSAISETDPSKRVTFAPFFCEVCNLTFQETSRSTHLTSTIHKFNEKSSLPENKLRKFNITPRNRGLQLMVKQGWDKESGLGPNKDGRLYPIKTVIRKERTGLGIEQSAARVTHFEAFDPCAIQRGDSDYYKRKHRNRNNINREKVRERKKERRLRNELS